VLRDPRRHSATGEIIMSTRTSTNFDAIRNDAARMRNEAIAAAMAQLLRGAARFATEAAHLPASIAAALGGWRRGGACPQGGRVEI
jgi:hypothetical protein